MNSVSLLLFLFLFFLTIYISVLTDSYQIPMFNNEPIEQSVSLLKHRPKRRGETKEPLPADIRAKAVYYFRHSYHQSMIITSMSFSLRCNNNLTKLIYERFPMADLFWEFNSQPLRVDPSRTSYKPLVNEMTILVAGPEDSGVYACKMAQNWYWDQIVEIFVVQVQSFMPTITSRERELMTLSCNSEALYELYSTINKTWRHNGEVIFTGTGAEGDGLTLHHTKVSKLFAALSILSISSAILSFFNTNKNEKRLNYVIYPKQFLHAKHRIISLPIFLDFFTQPLLYCIINKKKNNI